MRHAGLVAVLAGAGAVVVSTFLAWLGAGGFSLSLWDATSIESVVLFAAAFVAAVLAGLGLARGHGDVPAIVAAAIAAGLALALSEDFREVPEEVRGAGPVVAAAGGGVVLTGAALLALAATPPRWVLVAAAAVFAASLAFGGNVLDVHPEIQVIR